VTTRATGPGAIAVKVSGVELATHVSPVRKKIPSGGARKLNVPPGGTLNYKPSVGCVPLGGTTGESKNMIQMVEPLSLLPKAPVNAIGA